MGAVEDDYTITIHLVHPATKQIQIKIRNRIKKGIS